MAITGQEVEVVGPGIKAGDPQTGPYVQNMVYLDGSWQTRKGFGVVGEWDSTLSKLNYPVIDYLDQHSGYYKHLGSYLMETSFGHRQIITVLAIAGWTTQGIQLTGVTSNPPYTPFNNYDMQLNMFAVSIYDLTTRTRWEEILIPSTGDSAPPAAPRIGSTSSLGTDVTTAAVPGGMPVQRGYYDLNGYTTFDKSTRSGKSLEQIPITSSDLDPDPVSFVENRDILYFGNIDMGFFYYKPSAFIGNRSKAIDPLMKRPYSESSMINSLRLTPGVFSAAYQYATFLEGLTSITTLGLRLVYVATNRLYFSDRNKSASVIDGHFIDIPSESPLIGAQEINGNLLIWTKNETFLYMPNPAADFVNTGTVTKISANVGCLSANSFIKFDNTVMWVSETGIYSNGGDLSVGEMSKDIKPFFTNYLSNPLSHYRTQFGAASSTYKQPKIQHNLESAGVTIAYCPTLKGVIATFPEERCSFLMNSNLQWSLWNYDSIACHDLVTTLNCVGNRDFMDCQQIVADSKGIYAIGLDNRIGGIFNNGIQEDNAYSVDRYTPGGNTYIKDVNREQHFNSYFITEYGRGGGCDRSVDNEDYRYGIGEYHQKAATAAGGVVGTIESGFWNFIVGKPQRIEPGWSYDDGSTRTFSRGGILVPLIVDFPEHLLPTDNSTSYLGPYRKQWNSWQCTRLELSFQYDRENWSPAMTMDLADPKINCIFKTPMENAQAGTGNGESNFDMTANYEQMNRNSATGLPDVNGNVVTIVWNGPIGGHLDPTPAALGARPVDLSTRQFAIPRNVLTLGNGPGRGQGAGAAIVPGTEWQSPLPILPGRPTVVCWVPFERITNDAVSGLNVTSMRGILYSDAVEVPSQAGDHYRSSVNYAWEASSLGTKVYETDGTSTPHIQDNVTQGVDWAYLASPIGLDTKQPGQLKARGLFSTLESQGISSEPINHGWSPAVGAIAPRVFSTVVAADGAEWQGQILDQDPRLDIAAIEWSDTMVNPTAFSTTETQSQSIRTKIAPLPADIGDSPRYKVFGQDSSIWGNQGNPAIGTVLIDDPQVGTIAESNSTRGEWFSWIMFGFILDKAETLVLKGAKAILRKVSGRRRRGHNKE